MTLDNTPRTAAGIYKDMKSGKGFISNPEDVLTVELIGGVSNRIHLHLVGTDGTDCRFAISNQMTSWEWLKRLSEMGGREVMVETPAGIVTSYRESEAYMFRFPRFSASV